MKKKMANDKVIRAMAIGISAMLATAQPMTAFAAEPDSGDAGNNGVESEAKVSVEDVKSAVGNDKTVDDAVIQAGVVEEAAKEAKVAESKAAELKENVAAADAAMDETSRNVEAVDKAEDKLIEGKEEADNVVNSITENAAEAYATVKKASEKVDTYDAEIKNATSIAEANTAYDNIIVEVSNAEEACEEAEKKHAELMSDYDKALDEIETAKKAYEDAKGEGLGNIKVALEKLASAKSDAEAIRDKAIVVEAEIDILKDIEIQKTKVAKIANKEETGNYWREADKLANLMIKYSYIIRDDVDVNSISFSTWVSDKSDDNNVVVTYKLKGSDEEVTDYFDYVAYDCDGNDIVSTNKTPVSITVLKKTPTEETFASGAFVNKGDTYLSDNDILFNKIKNVDLLNAANEQIKRVEAAEEAVEKIKAQMEALDAKDFAFEEGGYESLLISYKSRLYAAEANLKAAQEKLDDIKNKEAVAKADLAATIARLTPAPVRRNNNNNRVPVVQEATPALDFVYAPGVAVAAAPMQMVAGGQPAQIAQDGGNAVANAAQGAGEVFDLGEAATPLADFAEEDETLNGITLQDEATPLVDFEQASRMSWWWLLVVAVLGVTGYELYEKHQKKIEARAEAAKKTK